MAEGVGRARRDEGVGQLAQAEVLRPGDVSVSIGRAAHGPRPQLRDGRCPGKDEADAGFRGAAPVWLGRVRAAGGKRGDAAPGPAPGEVDAGQHREEQARPEDDGHPLRLGPRGHQQLARLLQMDPVALPSDAAARVGLPGDGARELVPGRQDCAGQRAGDQRPLLATSRRRGREAGPRAVVLEDHRLRGPVARRPRPAGQVAAKGARHADQLDRPQHGGGGRLPGRRAPGRNDSHLHHAARHVVRRDVHGPCAGASAGRKGDDREASGPSA